MGSPGHRERHRRGGCLSKRLAHTVGRDLRVRAPIVLANELSAILMAEVQGDDVRGKIEQVQRVPAERPRARATKGSSPCRELIVANDVLRLSQFCTTRRGTESWHRGLKTAVSGLVTASRTAGAQCRATLHWCGIVARPDLTRPDLALTPSLCG